MEKNERLELAELLFPNITKTREEYEKMYPERNLPEGAMVTRFGPSPTGFVHMGSLFGSFIDSIYASLSVGFSRQEYWSGLPCPPPGIFPTQGLNSHPLNLLHCRWILYP